MGLSDGEVGSGGCFLVVVLVGVGTCLSVGVIVFSCGDFSVVEIFSLVC